MCANEQTTNKRSIAVKCLLILAGSLLLAICLLLGMSYYTNVVKMEQRVFKAVQDTMVVPDSLEMQVTSKSIIGYCGIASGKNAFGQRMQPQLFHTMVNKDGSFDVTYYNADDMFKPSCLETQTTYRCVMEEVFPVVLNNLFTKPSYAVKFALYGFAWE